MDNRNCIVNNEVQVVCCAVNVHSIWLLLTNQCLYPAVIAAHRASAIVALSSALL